MILLTLPTCGPCRVLKEMIEEGGIDCEILDANSSEGAELSAKHKVMMVPTLIIGNDSYSGFIPVKTKLGI